MGLEDTEDDEDDDVGVAVSMSAEDVGGASEYPNVGRVAETFNPVTFGVVFGGGGNGGVKNGGMGRFVASVVEYGRGGGLGNVGT